MGYVVAHLVLKLPVQYAQMGYVVAYLVEKLRYKREGRGFDSGWSHSLTSSGCPVALGSIQPLTEMSTIEISG
jgi:hypothetical protein